MKSLSQMAAVPQTEEYIGTGDAAIYNTVSKMKDIVSQSSKNPYVREWARKIVGRVAVNDKKGEASAIFDFVRDNVRYTRDPAGFEYMQTPPVIWKIYEHIRMDREIGQQVTVMI